MDELFGGRSGTSDTPVFQSSLGPMALPELLLLLPELASDIERGEDRLQECVRELRGRRATWREIGAALGVSRQAAWERFHRV